MSENIKRDEKVNIIAAILGAMAERDAKEMVKDAKEVADKIRVASQVALKETREARKNAIVARFPEAIAAKLASHAALNALDDASKEAIGEEMLKRPTFAGVKVTSFEVLGREEKDEEKVHEELTAMGLLLVPGKRKEGTPLRVKAPIPEETAPANQTEETTPAEVVAA